MATALETQGYTAVPLNVDITRADDDPLEVTWKIYAATSDAVAEAVGGGATASALTGGVATITTTSAHGLSVGDTVVVAISTEPYDGTWVVESVPSATTFTYTPSHDDIATTADAGTAARVAYTTLASLTSNVVTLTTAAAHGFIADDTITVSGISATYNGSFTVVDAPTTTTLTYAKTAADDPEGPATSGVITGAAVGGGVTHKKLTDNVATITTASAHGLLVGQYAVVASLTDPFNGTWEITAKTATTFSFSLVYDDIAEDTDATGTVTATDTQSQRLVSAVLDPGDGGGTATATLNDAVAAAGYFTLANTYSGDDDRLGWNLVVQYYETEYARADRALQNYRLEQVDVVSQVPVASEVERDSLVRLTRLKKATVRGTIWPNTVGDDWNVIYDYEPALQFGIFTGVNPATTPTSGPQSSSGIAGSLGGGKAALAPGDRVAVADPSVTPTTGDGFVAVYKKAWFKDEYITLIPETGSAGSDTDYYWNGSAWAAGNNSGGTAITKIAGATIVAAPTTSTVQDEDGGTITVSGLTLAGLRKHGGLASAAKWPVGCFITITADGDAGTSNKAHWDGQKWADGAAPNVPFFTNPYDGYSM